MEENTKQTKKIKTITRKEILREVGDNLGVSYQDLMTIASEVDNVVQHCFLDVSDDYILRIRLANWLYIDSTIVRNEKYNLVRCQKVEPKRTKRLNLKPKISRFFKQQINEFWKMLRE